MWTKMWIKLITNIMSEMLDAELEELAYPLELLLDEKLNALEKKLDDRFKAMEKEVDDLKHDFNASLNHVEQNINDKLVKTWEYAVQNEQYSRKNNIRIYGIAE